MVNLKTINVFITGPTRSGTTFLLALFHRMRFYTGFDDRQIDNIVNSDMVAGLEYLAQQRQRDAYPLVIKHPLSWEESQSLFRLIDNHKLKIRHMVVTTREHEALVRSNMVFISKTVKDVSQARLREIEKKIRGRVPTLQKEVFAVMEEREIPYTIIEFPRMVYDKEYLFDNIKHIRRVTREKFDLAFDQLADKEKVHF